MAAKKENKRITRLKKFWLIVANVAFAILILVGLLLAISLLPINNNYKVYAVMSGSMEPSISVGSAIIIKPQSQYRVGEVITFLPTNAESKKETITHRIASIVQEGGQNFIRTKGDANENADEELVLVDRVIGKELFTVPLVGYVLGFIKTLPGLLLIIIVPSVIIIYEEVRKIHREVKEIISRRRDNKHIFKKVKIMRKKGKTNAQAN